MIFQKPIFGLDISDRSIEMVEVRLARAKWRVKLWDRVELAPGIVEKGQIKNAEALMEALHTIQKRGKFPKNGRVLMSFPDNQVFTTTVTLPTSLDKKEIEKTVYFKAREALPIELESSQVDWIQSYANDDYVEYVVSATPKEDVETYKEVLEKSGLTPWYFDIQPLCVARSLGKEEGSEPVVLVDMGETHTIISVLDIHGMRTNIYLQTGGIDLTNNLADKMKISFEEAEALKIKHGLGTFTPADIVQPESMPETQEEEEEVTKKPKKKTTKPVTKKKKSPSKKKVVIKKPRQKKLTKKKTTKPTSVESILQANIGQLIQEIAGTISYYQDRQGEVIKEIVLIGGGAQLKGLKEFIKQETGITAVLGEVRPDVVKLPSDPLYYMNAIGAGIRGFSNRPDKEGINLLKNI